MLVPKLRFKEFKNEWNEITLKKLLSFKNGINGDKDSYGYGIKYISVGDILNNTYIMQNIAVYNVVTVWQSINPTAPITI